MCNKKPVLLFNNHVSANVHRYKYKHCHKSWMIDTCILTKPNASADAYFFNKITFNEKNVSF